MKIGGDMRNFVGLLILILLTGCLVKTYTIEVPRQDIEINGNRGYLYGQPKEKKTTVEKKTRSISVIEFDFGPRYTPSPSERKITEENKGKDDREIISEMLQKENMREIIEEDNQSVSVNKVEKEEEEEKDKYEFYTVQKNDTLQKISQKFYGTTRKWKFIYNYNTDVIKDPDKIKPGMTLKIPKIN